MTNSPSEQLLKKLNAFDDFIIYLQTNNYSPETVYHYQRDLLMFAYFLHLKNISLQSMDKKLVNEFKAYLASNDRKTPTKLQESGHRLSSASINRCLSAVRAYIKFLIDNDIKCPVMPDHFKMVKRERSHPNIADFEEFVALIESPSKLEHNPLVGSRNRAMLELLFSTGMRISELLSLNRRDINDSGRIFITGKGRKQRFVYMTDRAKFWLDEYLKLRHDDQQALFVPTKGKNINKKHRRIAANYLQEKIKQYREKLRINIPISAHSMRHGFATFMAEQGASLAALQILLGHESPNTTTRYVNPSDRFAEDTHRRYHPLAKK